jgi:hypothetical protein
MAHKESLKLKRDEKKKMMMTKDSNSTLVAATVGNGKT